MANSEWNGAGTKEGIEVWGIENGRALKIHAGEHGKFYSGSTYIILMTRVKPSTGELERNIHFWIGEKASAGDEETLIMKMMELDTFLGFARVKYRECQGNESHILVSQFKGGIRYIPGTLQSGVDSTDGTVNNAKLYHVKGKRNVRVKEVEVSVRSMNKGDCFILDTPAKIWVYLGKFSKRVEKVKAVQAANQIRDQDHSAAIEVQVVDIKSAQDLVEAYFAALGGGSRAEVAEPPAEDDDGSFEEGKVKSVTLYEVSDASGEVKVQQVGLNDLRVEMLKRTECFILDSTAQAEIYVWIGNSCSQQEKSEAFNHARKFLVEKSYPASTQIQCIVDGREPASFKQFFSDWSKPLPESTGVANIRTTIPQAPQLLQQVDLSMITSAKKRAKLLKNLGTCLTFCPDDGTGKAELWRIEDFQLAPVPEETYGLFFGGDSYVLKYTYLSTQHDDFGGDNGERYIIYYWQGKESSIDEVTASALHAVKLDEELQLRATLIRVQQGYEPAHFLRIFRGRIIIFLGGHASGFKNLQENDTYDPNEARLFHVRSTCGEDTRAVQVELTAASLASDDVFVLDGSQKCSNYIWIGLASSDHEKLMGQKILNLVNSEQSRPVMKIYEGDEPDEFWQLLGGKKGYTKCTTDNDMTLLPVYRPRLFHCSIPEDNSNKLKVEEVFNFSQEELYEDDVMVLDTGGDEIFVWLGNGATPNERTYSMRMADEYTEKYYVRCGVCVKVSLLIKQNYEPDAFKSFFLTWDNFYWKRLKEHASFSCN